MLRAVADDDHGLLDRAARNLRRAVDQQARVELAGARDAEEARCGMRSGRGPAERKVRVVFSRTAGGGASVKNRQLGKGMSRWMGKASAHTHARHHSRP